MAWKLKVRWEGENLKDKVRRAAKQGTEDTVAACITTSKRLVRVDTAYLQGSLQYRDESAAELIRFLWGSFNVEYAIYQEIGPVSGVRQWAFTPYLRPSADQNYPYLADNIQRRL